MYATKYKILIQACPFPFEHIAIANSLKSAIGKAKFAAKMMNLKTGKLLEHEVIGKIEIKKDIPC
jgi:hypothetical protein